MNGIKAAICRNKMINTCWNGRKISIRGLWIRQIVETINNCCWRIAINTVETIGIERGATMAGIRQSDVLAQLNEQPTRERASA